MNRFVKAVAHPGRTFARAVQLGQQRLSALFADSAFFLQGQMDVHPRSRWRNDDFVSATGGFFLPGDPVPRRIMNLEPWDLVRRDMLVLLLRSLNQRRVPGDLAELGVYRGFTARLFHHYMPDRALHLFDTFAGFDPHDVQAEERVGGRGTLKGHFADTSVEGVLRFLERKNDNVHVYPGRFPDTIPPELESRTFALVHLDADLYEPTLAGLRWFYPRIAPGGFVVVHDYNAWPGARRAVDEFFAGRPQVPVPMPDKSGSVVVPIAAAG